MIESQESPLIRDKRAPRGSGFASAALALATGVLYLLIIQRQDGFLESRVVFVATLIGLFALASYLGVVIPSRKLRPLLLSGAAIGLLLLGVLGIFSIGLPLLFAALFAGVAVVGEVKRSPDVRKTLAFSSLGAVLAGLFVIAAFFVSRPPLVRCDDEAVVTSSEVVRTMGSVQDNQRIGTITLRDGSVFSYTCENGKLVRLEPK